MCDAVSCMMVAIFSWGLNFNFIFHLYGGPNCKITSFYWDNQESGENPELAPCTCPKEIPGTNQDTFSLYSKLKLKERYQSRQGIEIHLDPSLFFFSKMLKGELNEEHTNVRPRWLWGQDTLNEIKAWVSTTKATHKKVSL